MPTILVEPWTSAAFASPRSSSLAMVATPRVRLAGGGAEARPVSGLRRPERARPPVPGQRARRDDRDGARRATASSPSTCARIPTGLDAAALAQYDARRLLHLRRSVRRPRRCGQALLAFVASGKGFVGFHSATDSFYSWPEYGDFIGARFINHGSENLPGTIRVEDPNHVAMQGFTNPFTFTEEFYLFRGPSATSVDSFTRRDLHVLMNLDPATPDARAPGAAAAVPAAPGDRPPAGLDAPARRRPRVLFGLRPSAGDLGQPAVPRPRGRRDPLGAVRRRRRRPDDAWETAVGAARLRRDRRQRAPRRSRRRRPDERPGAARRHPPARLRAALSRGRRDQHLLRDAESASSTRARRSRPASSCAISSTTARSRPTRSTLAPRSRRTMIAAGRRRVLDADRVGSRRRRRPHDDLGPRTARYGSHAESSLAVPGARLVLRRRRDARRLRPVLPGAEPERPGRRGRRPLPARSGRRRRAGDAPLHRRRAPAPDDQRRLHSRASRPPTSPASSTARTARRSSSSARCT